MPASSPYSKAEKAYAAGKPEEALALCKKVGRGDPDYLNSRALAAECLAELDRWPEACRMAQEALQEDPAWATGYLICGLAFLRQVDLERAEDQLRQAWDADHQLGEAALLLAVLADFRGERDEADRWQERAAGADPDVPFPFHFSESEFDEVLVEAMQDFDGLAARSLEESRFQIVPMPSREDLATGTPVDALYRIVTLDPESDPPTFHLMIFQRNIERSAASDQDVFDRLGQILTAVLGELAQRAKTVRRNSGD